MLRILLVQLWPLLLLSGAAAGLRVTESGVGLTLTVAGCAPNATSVAFDASNASHTGITAMSVEACLLSSITVSELTTGLASPGSITSLSWRGNQIAAIDGLLEPFTGLTAVNGGENVVVFLAVGTFATQTALLTLDITNNLLTGLADGIFDPLQNLEKLLLNDNRITSVSEKFQMLGTLKHLHLGYNSIEALDPHLIRNNTALTYINLNSNLIRTLPPDFLEGNPALTYFCAHNNMVEAIPDRFFQSNPVVERAHFNRNNIAAVQSDALVGLTKLVYAPLDHNPIECECNEGTNGANIISCSSCSNAAATQLVNGTFSCQQFQLSAAGLAEAAAIQAAVNRDVYYVGETTNIAGFVLDRATIFENAANNDSDLITFSMRFQGAAGSPGTSVFANSVNGYMAATPDVAGVFDATLQAHDALHQAVDVVSWSMVTAPRAAFSLGIEAACLHEIEQLRAVAEQLTFFVGETHVIPGFKGCNRTNVFMNPAGNDYTRTDFRLEFSNASSLWSTPVASDDNMVNLFTGKMSLTPTTTGTFRPRLRGTDGVGRIVTVYEFTMVVTNRQTEDEPVMSPEAWAITISSALLLLIVVAAIFIKHHLREKALLVPHDFSGDFSLLPSLSVARSATGSGAEGDVEMKDGRVVPTELKRHRITLGAELGKGAFGIVRQALYMPPGNHIPEFEVAVKQLRADPSTAEREELFGEAFLTAQFSHQNVIRFIGVVTSGSPMLLVLQFCSLGALKSILEQKTETVHLDVQQTPTAPTNDGGDGVVDDNGVDVVDVRRRGSTMSGASRQGTTDIVVFAPELITRSTLPLDTIFAYCIGICRGMKYLSSCNFVHRDLATRNVLVDSSDRAKVADFGLSRDLEASEYYTMSDSNGKLPLRWAAPETITRQRFSEKSDVWSFGVTLIECWSCAAMPYRGWMNSYVVEQVCRGYVPPKPHDCPDAVYQHVILPSFDMYATTRPGFAELFKQMEELAPRFGEKSIYEAAGTASKSSSRKPSTATSELLALHREILSGSSMPPVAVSGAADDVFSSTGSYHYVRPNPSRSVSAGCLSTVSDEGDAVLRRRQISAESNPINPLSRVSYVEDESTDAFGYTSLSSSPAPNPPIDLRSREDAATDDGGYISLDVPVGVMGSTGDDLRSPDCQGASAASFERRAARSKMKRLSSDHALPAQTDGATQLEGPAVSPLRSDGAPGPADPTVPVVEAVRSRLHDHREHEVHAVGLAPLGMASASLTISKPPMSQPPVAAGSRHPDASASTTNSQTMMYV